MNAQELYDLFQERQSDRKFDLTRPVEPEVLHRIVSKSQLAPSACNTQPWEVVIVSDTEQAKQVGEVALKGIVGMNKFVATAPAHILIIAERPNIPSYVGGKLRGIDFVPYDIGIFMAHVSLAAAAEGLGSCIIGMFNGKGVAELLGIPKGHRVLFDIVVGYSQDKHRDKKRKSEEEVVHFNKW